MPYQVARDTPLPAVGAWSDRMYQRHGIARGDATRWRRLGIPATVAKVLADTATTSADQYWLAITFSTTGLRRLTRDGRFRPGDTRSLRTAAATDLTRARAYVSRTAFPAAEIAHLVFANVPVRLALAWHAHLPAGRTDIRLAEILRVATVVHGCPVNQCAEWVRFAVRHGVNYLDGVVTEPPLFLGGETALFLAAGVSPDEATAMVAHGPVDRASLRMLAALRRDSTP